MTKVTVTSGPEGVVGINVEGHAGYDRHGKDIVCAAASALAYAAAGALEELAGIVGCCADDDSKGVFTIALPQQIDAEARRTADVILKTARTGYRQIAKEYPKYLALVENYRADGNCKDC